MGFNLGFKGLSRKHRCQILHTQVIYAIAWVFSCSRWKDESYTPVYTLANPQESDMYLT